VAYPPKIEQLPYNWSSSRSGHAIVAIIAHGTAGTDSRAYLSRGGDLPDGSDRKVSIHALIQKPGDPIYRYVPDDIGANHAGYGTMPPPWTGINPNKCTLGFELENLQNGSDPYPDTQLLAMGWLINQWRAKWGALPILRHADIDPARRSDTVGLSIAQIEQWAVKAAQSSDPLKARTLQGPPPEGRMMLCSVAAANFYNARGGLKYCGYPLRDEFHDISLNCGVLVCERVVVKESAAYGVEQALWSEARSEGWLP
jgi:hypothetical protein